LAKTIKRKDLEDFYDRACGREIDFFAKDLYEAGTSGVYFNRKWDFIEDIQNSSIIEDRVLVGINIILGKSFVFEKGV